MIREKDILLVGHTQKPHGIKGEIVFLFKKPGYAELDVDFYFLDMDGIPVPFFVEECTGMTEVSARVKFEEIEDAEAASRIVNKQVYLPRELANVVSEDKGTDWHYFIGFDVIDHRGTYVGSIREVDDSTINVLFIVVREEEDHLIPATEDFILALDERKRLIEMQLPEGLLDS